MRRGLNATCALGAQSLGSYRPCSLPAVRDFCRINLFAIAGDIPLLQLHAVFFAHPLSDEALGLRVDLERLLNSLLQAIAAQ